jgi:hypothetical protein
MDDTGRHSRGEEAREASSNLKSIPRSQKCIAYAIVGIGSIHIINTSWCVSSCERE